MTANHSTAATLSVAIDISKHRHEVLIGIPGKKRRRRLTIMNTLEDFQRLSAALASYDLPVRIGFEATGNYHRTLVHHLGQAGFELKLVSSVGLARTREALNNSWDKNDPKDVQVILHMLEIGAVQFFHDPLVVGTGDIQELSKTHEIVSRSKTALWHRILTHYLPLYFPEAERFHRSSRTDWFLAFLEKYPSPHMITAMSRDAFIADAWEIIGRKVSKELLLSDIYASAVSSVGLPVHPDSDAVRMFRLVLAEGRNLIRQRDEIEARAVELLSDLPDYQLLTTIPGIGPINAMTILAEAGDLRRFRHHRQFLKFSGMDLATVQSGMFRGHPSYCVRVTADDGAIGDKHLRDFQDNEKTIPTVLTTSQKLSTGVDARNVRNIVLMRPIRSMIEFKQIIGRGTRVYEGKDFFTIWDFVKAYENFNDPEWDGEPIDPVPPNPRPPQPPPEPPVDPGGPEGGDDDEPKEKIRIKLADGKTRAIRYIATTTYWSADGKPISAQEFMERLFGDLTGLITNEEHLRKVWSDPDSRETFLQQLSDRGYDEDRLNDIRRLVDAPESDLFDVLGYVLFTNDPKTRHDRANVVKSDKLASPQTDLKELLINILEAYEENGESELATKKLTQFLTAQYGSVSEAKAKLGGLPNIREAFRRMQAQLYSS